MVRTAASPARHPARFKTGTRVLAFAVFLGAASMTVLIALGQRGLPPRSPSRRSSRLCGVYTAWLKRATPQKHRDRRHPAGAAPPLLGWAAVAGMRGRGTGRMPCCWC